MEFRIDSGRICVAQRNGAGALTLYGRIARADHRMPYRSATGDRYEIIPASELFRADSLATFQTLPVTHEHPASRVMTADSWRVDGRGSTHPTFIREITPQGTFLGQLFTVYDKDLADQIEAQRVKGLSPGYSVDSIDQIEDGVFAQRMRRGNHLAVVANPRGGAGVEAVLEGIRSDSTDSIIWVCDAADDLWDAPVADDYRSLITSALGGEMTGLLDKTPIVLPGRIDAKKMPPWLEKKIEGDDEGDDEESCGADCDCKDCKSKKKGKKRMDGQDLNALITERVDQRIDALSEAQAIEQERADSNDRIDSLEEENANLREMLQEAADTIDELIEGMEDEEDDDREDSADQVVFDSPEEFAATMAQGLIEYQQLRSDALLVGGDIVKAYGGEVEAITGFVVDNQSLKQEILAKVAPTVRLDSLNDDSLDAVYEVTMTPLRQAGTRADSAPNRSIDRLKLLGELSPTAPVASGRKLSDNFYSRETK